MNPSLATQAAQRRFEGRELVWRLLGLAVSISIVGYLLSQVELQELYLMIKRAPVWSLPVAFGIYMSVNFFRALRFRVLLEQRSIPLALLFPIALYHNFLVRTLPFMSGEISYVVLLRGRLNRPIREGISSLLGARLFELLLVISGGVIGLLTTGEHLVNQRQLIPILLVLGLATCVTGLYFAGSLVRIATQAWGWIARRGPWQASKIIVAIEQKMNGLALRLDRFRQPRLFLQTLLLTLCTYGLSVAFNLWLLRVIGVERSVGIVLAVISIGMLASSFPISIGGFGIIEGGWTAGLVILAGLEVREAASAGFFLHGCQLLSAALSGLIGYLLLQMPPRPSNQTFPGQEPAQ